MADYNNRSLFSDYYLEERAPEDPHWQTLRQKAWEYRQRVGDILEKATPGINGNTPEAEVERRLIRPILDVLGHVYFVQPAVPSPEGVKHPDYAFFPSVEARQEAESHKGQMAFFKTALAVGDAKAWQRSLDKRVKGRGDPFTNHNPSYQIDFYLRATDKKWGLLTNGRHWRIYYRDLSYRLDVYYEVDLPRIITQDEEAFLYFLAFFNKDAFQPDGTGECFLDRAYRASTEYAAKVSEELKDNVYEALRLLAEGFLSFPGNKLKPDDLDLVRENAFVVIYRLLFILYAEAREFLPATNLPYEMSYSLRALAHDIVAKEPFESNLSPVTTGYWTRLKDLFTLINDGDKFLHIPPYNGRLFDDEKEHQALAAWKIGDRHLAAAIDQLARAEAAGRTGRGFVSYRDLSIRELGSIYEGLLQHRPRYASQDMAVVKEDKREKFIPLAELASRKPIKVYPAGSVYLETDKGERKATGSYYTPDYIVKYTVTNTLEPLLNEASKSDGSPIDAILSLKVLDPAMGSGHFLVEATDYLGRALVEALGGDPREIDEDEIRWARREVIERCIYGVDLNPLAVDLAKLSLWLSTVALDKPLSFLDHHLRCGNSLIGARLDDLGQLPGFGKKKLVKAVPASQSLLEYYFHQNVATAVDNYFRIAEIPSDGLPDIQEKEKLYGIAQHILRRYQEVAHIWTSTYFGNESEPQDYDNLLTSIRDTEADWAEWQKQAWFASGVKTGQERRLFHWELEFPEVFFDRNGQQLPNAGFSAIVGNPPYVYTRLQEFTPQEKGYYLEAFKSGFGKVNTYALFMEAALQLLADGGRQAYIIPNTILRATTYAPLRKLLLDSCSVENILLCGTEVFEGVTSETIVLSVYAQSSPMVRQQNAVRVLASDGGVTRIPQSQFEKNIGFTFSVLQTASDETIVARMQKYSHQLRDLASHLISGIQTWKQHKSAFIADSALDHRYKPLLEGKDIGRYQIYFRDKFIQYDKSVLNVMQDEAIFQRPEKILVQRVAGGTRPLTAAIDRERYYPFNSLNTIVLPGDSYSHSFVASLLNSTLLSYYYAISFSNRSDLTVNISNKYLGALPIRSINFTTPQAERDDLVAEAKRLYEQYPQSKDTRKQLSFVVLRLPQKPDGTPDTQHEQSDVVHDLLAFLAEEMTRLHKEKQAEIKGFLTWLEGYLGIGLEHLKNKTKVKEYWKPEAGWESFLDAFKQNRRLIHAANGIDITRREPQATIRPEFDASTTKLKPLLHHIELTDKLIDQIVYKLYGLTEDEIAIVKEEV
ncbi:MAG: N-6 DNA methylase [Dehalococcoidia bacterium]|nr:N-6 DNA methylase [Dehalococcoidia bacterium]